MGYRTKVQLIKRAKSEQWYINFPSAVAQAMEFTRGETAQWCIEDKETLVLQRPEAPPRKLKKNLAVSPRGNRRDPRRMPGILRTGAELGESPAAPPEPPGYPVPPDDHGPDHNVGTPVLRLVGGLQASFERALRSRLALWRGKARRARYAA